MIEIGEFRKTPRGRDFLILGYSCLKSHENGFRSCEVGNGRAFRFQRNGTECLMRGLSLDSPWLGWNYFGQYGIDFWTKIVHVCCLHVIA